MKSLLSQSFKFLLYPNISICSLLPLTFKYFITHTLSIASRPVLLPIQNASDISLHSIQCRLPVLDDQPVFWFKNGHPLHLGDQNLDPNNGYIVNMTTYVLNTDWSFNGTYDCYHGDRHQPFDVTYCKWSLSFSLSFRTHFENSFFCKTLVVKRLELQGLLQKAFSKLKFIQNSAHIFLKIFHFNRLDKSYPCTFCKCLLARLLNWLINLH